MLCIALIQCLENFSCLFVKGHVLHKDVMVGRNPHFDGSQKYVLSSNYNPLIQSALAGPLFFFFNLPTLSLVSPST